MKRSLWLKISSKWIAGYFLGFYTLNKVTLKEEHI
jgi:hypothetical protein